MDTDTEEPQVKLVKLTIEEIIPLVDNGDDEILKAQACLIANGRHEYLIEKRMLQIVNAEVVTDD